MTPRSRKPLIITSDQRESLPAPKSNPSETSKTSDVIYQSISPNNDSDFVSSDDDMSRSIDRDKDANVSANSGPRAENTRFVLSVERPFVSEDLNTTLCGEEVLLPKFKLSHEMSDLKMKSLSAPFREYLNSRSVLTATPVDLSILNKSSENTSEEISDSLLYCLDGNVPSDLTSSISNLAVEKSLSAARSPLRNLDSFVNIDASKSPNRKRLASSKPEDSMDGEIKKALVEKENVLGCDVNDFALRETDL